MSMTDADDFDLEADLAAALDGTAHETPAQAQERETAPQEGETASEAEERARYVREGRRFVKEGGDKKDGDPAEAADPQQQQQPPKEKRPTWYKDEYGDWSKLPENFRNALREQERNAAQAIEKHSTAAKAWEPVNKLIEPHLAELRAAGVEPQQYVSNLINADKYLRQDPVAAMNWLAQQYAGMDVIQLAQWMYDNGQQPEQVDPVQQELAALRAELQQIKQLPVQQRREAAQQQIADWSKDKPDFPAVRQTMAALAKAKPEASLDDLYQEAQWAHPEIRERILQEREGKRLKELQGKRQAGATSPRTGANGAHRAQPPRMSLEDEIAMHLDGGV